jgi:hypothetical protein|tara:strand:- start:16 stop:588 length:573 start_codon:yes stop_codon:yes gene_type:complete
MLHHITGQTGCPNALKPRVRAKLPAQSNPKQNFLALSGDLMRVSIETTALEGSLDCSHCGGLPAELDSRISKIWKAILGMWRRGMSVVVPRFVNDEYREKLRCFLPERIACNAMLQIALSASRMKPTLFRHDHAHATARKLMNRPIPLTINAASSRAGESRHGMRKNAALDTQGGGGASTSGAVEERNAK